METLLQFIPIIIAGGPQAIIILLLLIIAALIFDRRRLVKDLEKKTDLINQKDAKIEKIVDDYFRGNLTLADALNSLKVVLIEIRSKI